MNEMFLSFTKECRTRVEQTLDRALPLGEDPTQLRAAMRYSLLNGGKRVRPILVYATGIAVAPETPINQFDLIAGALECLHSYSLVHDDLPAMDDDNLRRGQPTCHIAFDEATAILAGDALQTLAFDLICQTTFDPLIQIELVRQLSLGAGLQGMVLGQAIDLAAVAQQVSLDQLENMHRHKTGALICSSVHMAALAAGASQAQLTELNSYAAAIGLAFQVQDDILDITADTLTLGKQQGADLARNKPTYVSILGLAGAQAKARDLHQQACDALANFGPNASYLRQLATFIIKRSS